MDLTKLKCKCGHHYKVHASLEGCLACEGHYCGEGQVSILENAHAALETANADLLKVCECALSSIKQKLMFGSGEDVRTERDMISALLEQAIRKHKGK